MNTVKTILALTTGLLAGFVASQYATKLRNRRAAIARLEASHRRMLVWGR